MRRKTESDSSRSGDEGQKEGPKNHPRGKQRHQLETNQGTDSEGWKPTFSQIEEERGFIHNSRLKQNRALIARNSDDVASLRFTFEVAVACHGEASLGIRGLVFPVKISERMESGADAALAPVQIFSTSPLGRGGQHNFQNSV
jgi:hypothetical protein